MQPRHRSAALPFAERCQRGRFDVGIAVQTAGWKAGNVLVIFRNLSGDEVAVFRDALAALTRMRIPGDGEILSREPILADLSIVESFIAGVVSTQFLRFSPTELGPLLAILGEVVKLEGEQGPGPLAAVTEVLKSAAVAE